MTQKRTDGLIDWILTGIFAALAARGTKNLVTAGSAEDATTEAKPRRTINALGILFVIGSGILSVAGFTGQLDQFAGEWDKDASALRATFLILSVMVCLFFYAVLINPRDRWSVHILTGAVCWIITLALWGTTYDSDPLKTLGLTNAALMAVALTGAAIMYCLSRVVDVVFFG